MLSLLAQATKSTAGSEATRGLRETAGTAGFGTEPGDLSATIGNIISVVLGLVGFIFIILVIYGGFLWMTASGDEKKVEKARGIITYAVIGLAIIAAAYMITNFVFTQVLTSVGLSPS